MTRYEIARIEGLMDIAGVSKKKIKTVMNSLKGDDLVLVRREWVDEMEQLERTLQSIANRGLPSWVGGGGPW